jgi:hypothetical protein
MVHFHSRTTSNRAVKTVVAKLCCIREISRNETSLQTAHVITAAGKHFTFALES